jgi:hypothetical protein
MMQFREHLFIMLSFVPDARYSVISNMVRDRVDAAMGITDLTCNSTIIMQQRSASAKTGSLSVDFRSSLAFALILPGWPNAESARVDDFCNHAHFHRGKSDATRRL